MCMKIAKVECRKNIKQNGYIFSLSIKQVNLDKNRWKTN